MKRREEKNEDGKGEMMGKGRVKKLVLFVFDLSAMYLCCFTTYFVQCSFLFFENVMKISVQ